jgi:hypothetical protein
MAKSRAKAQSSLEYMLIVALTFTIIIPATYLFYNYSKDSSQEITDAQITKLGRNLVDSAEKIYYSGLGSKTTIDFNIPDGVTSAVIIDGKELVFNITSTIGTTEIVFFSAVNVSTSPQYCTGNVCSLPGLSSPGLKKVKVEAATRDSVRIDSI